MEQKTSVQEAGHVIVWEVTKTPQVMSKQLKTPTLLMNVHKVTIRIKKVCITGCKEKELLFKKNTAAHLWFAKDYNQKTAWINFIGLKDLKRILWFQWEALCLEEGKHHKFIPSVKHDPFLHLLHRGQDGLSRKVSGHLSENAISRESERQSKAVTQSTQMVLPKSG